MQPAQKPFKISQKMLVVDESGVRQKNVSDVIRDQASKDMTNPMLVGSYSDLTMVLERLESDNPQHSRAEVDQLVYKPSQWILNYLDECYFPNNEDGVFHHSDLETFAACINTLCVNIDPTTAILDLKSPVYVLGDIHGNYKDLNYLSKNVIQFNNLKYSAANLLFLGDYVDRGPYSVETAAWILAMRARFPQRVHVLRGNHEFYSVNGDESTYTAGSFFHQCKDLWGPKKGEVSRCPVSVPLPCICAEVSYETWLPFPSPGPGGGSLYQKYYWYRTSGAGLWAACVSL